MHLKKDMYAANFETEPGVGHESKVCSFRKW